MVKIKGRFSNARKIIGDVIIDGYPNDHYD